MLVEVDFLVVWNLANVTVGGGGGLADARGGQTGRGINSCT